MTYSLRVNILHVKDETGLRTIVIIMNHKLSELSATAVEGDNHLNEK